jgi:peptide/nickel transport system permease protein
MQAVPVVFGVTIATFLLLHLVPGDPARTMLGDRATPQLVAALHHRWGLDRSLFVQFGIFLGHLVHADTGTSLFYGISTRSLIAQRAGVTAALVALSTVFCILITVPLATLAAVRRDRPADHAIRILPLFGLSMPSFWVGILLILVFSVSVHWFPVGGYGTTLPEHVRSLVLPALTAALAIVPLLIRSLRAGMLEVLDADFVASARAKGLREGRVLVLHVARNALVPTVSLLGVNIAFLIGSTLVIERVFNLNGLGGLMLDAISNRDFPVVQGVTFVFALAVVAITLITDLICARLDPRVAQR